MLCVRIFSLQRNINEWAQILRIMLGRLNKEVLINEEKDLFRIFRKRAHYGYGGDGLRLI
jgi:hypothetical protein